MYTIYTDDVTVYDSDIEDIRQELQARDPDHPVTEEEINDEIYSLIDADWDDFEWSIDKDQQVLCVASLGLWHGRYAGGRIGKLYNLIREAGEDTNTIEYEEEDGTLHLTAAHHDGTNYFTFYGLNDKGLEYVDEYGDNKETHQYLVDHANQYLTKIKYSI